MVTTRKAGLRDKAGNYIEEGDIIAYACSGAGGRGAELRIGTVCNFTEKSISVEVPERVFDAKKNDYVSQPSKKIVSKEKADNIIILAKKDELDKIDSVR